MGFSINDFPLKPRFEFALEKARDFLIELEICTLPIDSFKLAELLDLGPIPFSKLNLPIWDGVDGFIQKNRFEAEQIFYNDYISSKERTRWTIMHEIGHSMLGHLNYEEVLFYDDQMPEDQYGILEVEAHYFASEVLAPTAVLKALNVQCHTDIMRLCGLSDEAARIRKKRFDHQDRWGTFDEMDQQIVDQFHDFIKRHPLCM
ncbi:ImmA/IrrE family metallo-endopeptidase [Laceyella tengchongensis]|jgi:hypothetical protein